MLVPIIMIIVLYIYIHLLIHLLIWLFIYSICLFLLLLVLFVNIIHDHYQQECFLFTGYPPATRLQPTTTTGSPPGLRLRWRWWYWTAAVHAHGLGSQRQGRGPLYPKALGKVEPHPNVGYLGSWVVFAMIFFFVRG